MYLKFLAAKKRLPLVKVINGEDILMTFNLEIKNEHQSSIDIKKSIEKYYDLPTKNQRLFLEGGYEDNCYWCNFYREIENRSKKIIISENNSKRKKSGNKVEIYQIFLRLTENNLRTDLPLPKIINEEQDDENKEDNEEIDNINNNSINNNLKKKIDNEEEEIGEQKMFRTIYTMKK